MRRRRFFASPRTGCAGSLLVGLVLFLLATRPGTAIAEFQVNTYTSYDQSAPAVAVDGEGNFVVVWEAYDQDGSGDGIFARRYDSTGEAIGEEFQVNTYTRRRQGSPSVAAHRGGDFVVVWSGSGENDYSGVFGRRYDSAGSPLGPDFQVNTYTSFYQGGAVVSADGEGGFVVVWLGYGGGDYPGVFGQCYEPGGDRVGGEFQANTYTGVAQTDPAVAAGASGGFVVVWSNYGQADSDHAVFGQRYDSNGNRVGTEFQVNSSTAYYSFDDEFRLAPAVAMDGSGGFVVVWNGYDEYYSEYAVFGRRYDGAGTPEGGRQFRVSTTPLGDSYPYPGAPAVAADDSGGFVVVWENYAGELGYYGVLVRRYDSTGAPQGDEFQINETNLTFDDYDYLRDPEIAANGKGAFVVVWDNYGADGYGYGIFAALLCGNGSLDPGEECDDGGRVAGDGCDAGCRVESCFTCAGEPSVCGPLVCPDDADPCTDDFCDPVTGSCYLPKPDDTPCDDANLCTRGDVCRDGACLPGPSVSCPDDGNPCTYDVCDPATGSCRHPAKPDDTPCRNQTACQADTGDICKAGQCTDADVCSAVEIIDEQAVGSRKPRLEVTCWGETREDFCKVQGFTSIQPGTMYRRCFAANRLIGPSTQAVEGALAEKVPVTKKVRKRIKRKTGKARIKLKLNCLGRQLLRRAFRRGEAFDVTVHVESRRAGRTSQLDYLVRLVRKQH